MFAREQQDVLWLQICTALPGQRRVFELRSMRRKWAPAPCLPLRAEPKQFRQVGSCPMTDDGPMAPARPRSITLIDAEETVVIEFCLGISRPPGDKESASKRGHFAETTMGYVQIAVCELRLAQGRVTPGRIVDAIHEGERRHPGCGLQVAAVPIQQFALEIGEERLGHGVVVGISDRAGGGADTRLFAS